MTARPLPLHPIPPAPAWLARELAAAPADRAILQRARHEIEAACEAVGVSFLVIREPLLSELILERANHLRKVEKAARRYGPRAGDGIEPPLISVREAARRLGMSEGFVRDHLLQGHIAGSKVGAHWRVDPSDLDAYKRRSGLAA